MDGKNTIFCCLRRDFAQRAKSWGGTLKVFDRSSQGLKECKIKKKGNIICRELYHEGVSALNETAPTLSRALSFQSLFMAAFATDLVAIFNEEHALLLRKLFSEPLCMRGRRPRSECNGWEKKAGNGQNRSIVHCNPCLNIWASRRTTHQPAQTDILRPKLSRWTIIKDFTVVHFHQTKKTSVYFQSSNSVSWTVTISYWIPSRLRNYQWNQCLGLLLFL